MKKLVFVILIFLAFGLVLPVFAAKDNKTNAQSKTRGEGLQTRSQNAIQHMSEVAKQVQLLLQTTTKGGIGEQVREIAREQNESQKQIEEELNKLESKSKLARLLTGTDSNALQNIKAQLVQNQVRVRKLEKLQSQLTSQSETALVQQTIQALNQENTSLQEKIATEEQTKSLLGWLLRFLGR